MACVLRLCTRKTHRPRAVQARHIYAHGVHLFLVAVEVPFLDSRLTPGAPYASPCVSTGSAYDQRLNVLGECGRSDRHLVVPGRLLRRRAPVPCHSGRAGCGEGERSRGKGESEGCRLQKAAPCGFEDGRCCSILAKIAMKTPRAPQRSDGGAQSGGDTKCAPKGVRTACCVFFVISPGFVCPFFLPSLRRAEGLWRKEEQSGEAGYRCWKV